MVPAAVVGRQRFTRAQLSDMKWEVAMLRKRKEPKAKKSVAEAILQDMQGTAAEKLCAV
jgi:hypothetical protein